MRLAGVQRGKMSSCLFSFVSNLVNFFDSTQYIYIYIHLKYTISYHIIISYHFIWWRSAKKNMFLMFHLSSKVSLTLLGVLALTWQSMVNRTGDLEASKKSHTATPGWHRFLGVWETLGCKPPKWSLNHPKPQMKAQNLPKLWFWTKTPLMPSVVVWSTVHKIQIHQYHVNQRELFTLTFWIPCENKIMPIASMQSILPTCVFFNGKWGRYIIHGLFGVGQRLRKCSCLLISRLRGFCDGYLLLGEFSRWGYSTHFLGSETWSMEKMRKPMAGYLYI